MTSLNYTLSDKRLRRGAITSFNLSKWRKERVAIAQRWLGYSLDEVVSEIQGEFSEQQTLPSYWFRYRAYLLEDLYQINGSEKDLLRKIFCAYRKLKEDGEKTKLLLILSLFFYAYKVQMNFNIDLRVNIENVSDDAARLLVIYLLNYPQILFNQRDANNLHNYYEIILQHILTFTKGTVNKSKKVKVLSWCTMIYVGANMSDRSLRRIYDLRGKLIEEYVREHQHILPSLDHSFNAGAKNDVKIKLGFVISRLEPTSETSVWLSHFRDLDKEVFETYLYRIVPKEVHDVQFEKYFLDCFDNVINLDCEASYDWTSEEKRDQATRRAVDLIRLDELDLLTFSGVPSNSFIQFESSLTPYRLAKKQFLLTAISPQTSGLSNVDYVISAPLVESEDAQNHFTETLILEEGSNNCFTFLGRRPNVDTEVTREALGIKPDQSVIISGSSMSKISTEALTVWLEVMSMRPDTVLVLFPYNPLWSDKYPMRLFEEYLYQHCQKQKVNPGRVIVLPPRENYYEVVSYLKIADIYADSFPFTGATSIVDALDVGLPTVVKRGKSQRAMQASAMHIEAGLAECVSYDNEEYKVKLLRLIDDVDVREELRRKISTLALNNLLPFRDMAQCAERFGRSLLRIHKSS